MGLPRNATALGVEALLAGLRDAGLVHLVLSPGSRSTPIVLAARATPGLVLHDVLDERAAGFFALGLARVTHTPVAVACTSGSAPAHYLPAVVEASASELPLVVLSANRPHRLEGTAESQTTDQTKLFGGLVRGFREFVPPGATDDGLRAARRLGAELGATARGPRPGPVHLDLRFDKPLEPDEADDDAVAARTRAAALATPRSVWPGRLLPDPAALEAVGAFLAGAERPLVRVGACAARDAASSTRLARGLEAVAARGVAVHLELSSGLRGAAGAGVGAAGLEVAVAAGVAPPPPDRVLQIGRAPLSPVLAAYAEPAELATWDATGFVDPTSRAALVVVGEPGDALAERARALVPSAYGHAVNEAAARAQQALPATLAGGPFGELHVAAAVASAPCARVVVGNSLPIRHLERVLVGHVGLEVITQRGVSGIDGMLAGIAGAQRGAPRPTVALLGDVTAAHDLGALPLLRGLTVATVVVVIDNGGGRIFDELPVARAAPDALAHFHTPPGLPLVELASALGLDAVACGDAGTLQDILAHALATPKATLVVVRVAPGSGRRTIDAWAAVVART